MSKMEKVQLTPNGPCFSPLVQGYWRMDSWGMSPAERLSFLQSHMDLGITTVDHAHVYGNPSCETLFGEALKLAPAVRNQIEIVTKCGIELPNAAEGKVAHYLSDAKSIERSLDLSLARLGVEHVDVLLLHRPDLLMDADEVAEAFSRLKNAGKVLHFGVSNFLPSQFSLLQSRLDAPLVTNQVEINPINLSVTEDGSLDFLQQQRVIPMAWSCLGGGRIFGEDSESMLRLRQTLELVKEELSADSVDQVLYAWVMNLPTNPIPIIGSGKITRIASAIKSLDLSLTQEQWYRIWTASKGHGVA